MWCYNTQHDNIQHNDSQHMVLYCDTRLNDIQHNGFKCDTQNNVFLIVTFFTVMLSVMMPNIAIEHIIPSVVMLVVVLLSVVAPLTG
jgi:hypothetical protein